jgi:hypothetical protein
MHADVQVERADAHGGWGQRALWTALPVALDAPYGFPHWFAAGGDDDTSPGRIPIVVTALADDDVALRAALVRAAGGTPDAFDGCAFTLTLANGTDGVRPHAVDVSAALAALPNDAPFELLLLPDAADQPAGLPADEALARTIAMQRAVHAHLDVAPHRFGLCDAVRTTEALRLIAQRDAIASPGLALYTPWLRVRDAAGSIVVTPPGGAVAGALARTDAAEGVWMPPTLHPLVGLEGLADPPVSRADDGLARVGVNPLRHFEGRGTMVWGARTLTLDADYRYLTVRRLVSHLTRSIATSLEWVVFEANDEPLWQRVRLAIEEFLHARWRAGAFAGTAPHQAWLVRCGVGASMTQTDVVHGRLIVIVGVAPFKPAEFVVSRIELRAGG